MGWSIIMTGWTGHALLAGLVLGCAGADGPDPGGAAPPPARPEPRPVPAVVITEIPPDGLALRRPRFISLAPRLAREGEPYRYRVAAIEGEGDEAVHLTLVRAPEGAALDGSVLKWTPEHAQAGRPQRFTLRAVDERGAAEDQTWMVTPGPEPRHGTRVNH